VNGLDDLRAALVTVLWLLVVAAGVVFLFGVDPVAVARDFHAGMQATR